MFSLFYLLKFRFVELSERRVSLTSTTFWFFLASFSFFCCSKRYYTIPSVERTPLYARTFSFYYVRAYRAMYARTRRLPLMRHIELNQVPFKANLICVKQKAGYHRHGDILPFACLLLCGTLARRTSVEQKTHVPEPLFRKESGSSHELYGGRYGLEPVTSCTSSRCSTS